MSWREALAFVKSHDLAAISGSDPQPIDIYGVLPWQRDIIAAAMMRRSEIVPVLARLPEKELQSLHERLGGFLCLRVPSIVSAGLRRLQARCAAYGNDADDRAPVETRIRNR